MTYRTKTGKSLQKNTRKSRSAKAASSPVAHLGPVTWAIGLLMVSVALAAAAVFTHKAG